MRADKLIYTFTSNACYFDVEWGKGTPTAGVDRMASIAHRHGIPVTWIVNAGSIPVLGKRIREWHDRFGDDVILHCPLFGRDIMFYKHELREALRNSWRLMEEAFPWVKTKVAARGVIFNEMTEVLEKEGFEGLWGYCWDQLWWDGITHKGVPWGSWYIDSSRYKVPHPGKGKLVAVEWTARDMNLTYHTSSPCLYSSDPNDVLRAGLCTGENIDYWKKMFDDYVCNTAHNEQVFFQQQQESQEMESTEAFSIWSEEDIEASAEMMDRFFEYITGYPITITTVPEAIKLYKEQNEEKTAPCYMLVKDSPIRPEINEYTMTMGGIGLGPWPDTFHYYDSECQMTFVRGECRPRLLRNYVGQWDMNGDFHEEIPPVFVKNYSKIENRIEMTFEIGHWRPIPFGLAYWDDLAGYNISFVDGVLEAKLILEEMVFLRINLTGEKKTVSIIMEKL